MLQNKENQEVPKVSFRLRDGDNWIERSTDDIFKNRKVVLFSLPGAYTPTFSSSHLPRYEQLTPIFKENGIDEVICLSVNDPFVMEAWGKDLEIDNVSLLADGNGGFTKDMGMLVDKTDLNFGSRSWRYSMFVDNGVIKKMFIEPVKDGDPFEVSDADTMMNYLGFTDTVPKNITVFSKPGCPHCARAKNLLESRGLDFEEIVLGSDATLVSLQAVSGRLTTPQIFVDGELIGGADELEQNINGI